MPGGTRKRGFKHFVQKGKLDVDPVTGCWIWLGYTKDGYGIIKRSGAKRSSTTAQHYFFELYRGPVPPGHDVAHRCHRRSCCRPHHTFAATRLENVREWFIDQKFNAEQREAVARMMAADLPLSVIADRMCAPRPYIKRLVKQLDWEKYQTSFSFEDADQVDAGLGDCAVAAD